MFVYMHWKTRYIRYVIDSGLARISRYNPRTRTRRLPVEPVSQSSANQRKGRAGRKKASPKQDAQLPPIDLEPPHFACRASFRDRTIRLVKLHIHAA